MDSTSDNSLRTLWGILKTAGTPDYVADGSLVSEKDASALPDTSFADQVGRRFPLVDKANTWASAGYFAKTAAEHQYTKATYDLVLSRIKRAAAIYGIEKDVEDVLAKIAAAREIVHTKVASDDLSNYCDPEHKGFPVFDKQGAELANDFFSRNAYKYGHERRQKIAQNIIRKSAEFKVKIAEQVRLSAGQGFPNRETLAEDLFFRANELMRRGTYKMAEELCKFAAEVCKCSDEELDQNRGGLFDAISGIDEMTGIDEMYGKKFHAPEEVVFEITPDSMKEVIDDAVPMGNETLSAKALAELPRALFEKVLPKEVVDGMHENGKITPKKLSITIISLKSPETSHLLRTIKDFTSGLIDVDEAEADAGSSVTASSGGADSSADDTSNSGDDGNKE